jgi:hypothetical protein
MTQAIWSKQIFDVPSGSMVPVLSDTTRRIIPLNARTCISGIPSF